MSDPETMLAGLLGCTADELPLRMACMRLDNLLDSEQRTRAALEHARATIEVGNPRDGDGLDGLHHDLRTIQSLIAEARAEVARLGGHDAP